MLPVVLRLRACQERHIELLEALHANPGNVGLHAQFDQAVEELVVVAAERWALEAEWGFVALALLPASAIVW
jgi:hypothetical protein